MLIVKAPAAIIKELEELYTGHEEYWGCLQAQTSEFWQRLSDYFEIDPRWLYDHGTREQDHPRGHLHRTGGLIAPVTPKVRDIYFEPVKTRAEMSIQVVGGPYFDALANFPSLQ